MWNTEKIMNGIIQWIKQNKKISITILILLILKITNPTRTEFKNYLGEKDEDGLKSKSNFFIFSFFAKRDYDYINGDPIENDNYYLGIAGNFFHLPKHKIDTSSTAKNLPYEISTRVEAVDSVSSSSESFDEYKVPIIRESWWDKAIDKLQFVPPIDGDLTPINLEDSLPTLEELNSKTVSTSPIPSSPH